jgi:hypothetical protein
MHAQFIVVPPLPKIIDLFVKTSGCQFNVDVKWSRWLSISIDFYEEFRKYIRPSHQQILIDTISGQSENPASLLRQLLRPHDYTIRRSGKLWTLSTLKKEGCPKGTHLIKENVVIDWNQ